MTLLLGFSSAAVTATDLPMPLGPADFIEFDASEARLGQQLFYDKILSGNRNISCGTCHHHAFGSSDGLSLGIGEGGVGVGTERKPGVGSDNIRRRIPRNAMALWNLGAKEISVMFHDGRLTHSEDYENEFNSPAEEWLPVGFNSLLAAQAVFPLTSRTEMAGDPEENSVARAAFDRIDHVWPILARRVQGIPSYVDQFVDTFTDVDTAGDITIVHVANALASFMGREWQSYDAPFDDWLAGDKAALDESSKRGLQLFYGDANCSGCHQGQLFTDQQFYALAIPPFGPGRTRLHDPQPRDRGRLGESDDLRDAYRFRTPSLRNAELTAPYGHNGAFPTLESIIRHHSDPLTSFAHWKKSDAALVSIPALNIIDFVVWSDAREMRRFQNYLDIVPVTLSQQDIADLSSFVRSLTGKKALNTPLGIPDAVPSGLPVDLVEP